MYMNKILTFIMLVALAYSANAQSQSLYEWKNGILTVRSVADVDSITFSLPTEGVVFSSGEFSGKSNTVSFTLITTLDISNANLVTEQGVCYSSSNELPTIEDSKVVYGTMFKGTWACKLQFLKSGMKYYYRPYLKIADEVFYGNVNEFTTSSQSAYNAIDLGLPSGILWADRNVGADAPEAYGDYFAWGETESKAYYDWSSYKWCYGLSEPQTKYCNIDGKVILELEDDAAYVNMGEEWRMPTLVEWQELLNNCNCEWNSKNGVNGRKFTGPNGNSIFLPAAGWREFGVLDELGSVGDYWSSSLYESHHIQALEIRLDMENSKCTHFYRYIGYPVRAVMR